MDNINNDMSDTKSFVKSGGLVSTDFDNLEFKQI